MLLVISHNTLYVFLWQQLVRKGVIASILLFNFAHVTDCETMISWQWSIVCVVITFINAANPKRHNFPTYFPTQFSAVHDLHDFRIIIRSDKVCNPLITQFSGNTERKWTALHSTQLYKSQSLCQSPTTTCLEKLG